MFEGQPVDPDMHAVADHIIALTEQFGDANLE